MIPVNIQIETVKRGEDRKKSVQLMRMGEY
jgi:hypothetical protein